MLESNRTAALPAKSNSIAQTAVFVFFMTLFSLIMVWDMKKMHDMSEVIHDDHTSMWERMNDTMIRSFWSPLDICMLKNNDSKVDIRTYRTKVCNKYSSSSVISSYGAQKLFCNAGSSIGKACPPPLSTRTYFMYRLRDSRFRDPRSTYLSESMRYLAKNRMPIVFIGDGLSKQNEDALICDLLRTDTSVTVSTNTASAKTNEKGIIEADYTIKWRATPSLKLEVKYFKVSYVEEDERIRKQYLKYRKGTRRAQVSNVTKSDESTKQLRPGHKRLISEDTVLNMTATVVSANTRSILSFDQLKNALNRFITSRNRSMALVANIGVWYNSREKFREELPEFLRWLHDLKDRDPKNVIFYRETAAQHWNHTESGYYDKEYHETHGNNNGTCEPIADASPGTLNNCCTL